MSSFGHLFYKKVWIRCDHGMQFKEHYNCYLRVLEAHRMGGVYIEVSKGTFAEWLGAIDRSVAKTLPGARQIPLNFAGWRFSELDSWTWLKEDLRIVGCYTDIGVFAVLDFNKPLLKRLSNSSSENGEV